MTDVARGGAARLRLADLGLSRNSIEKAVMRADAEARLTTDLDPPAAEGMVRYITTNRFLRQELVETGWSYDNPRNVCRTIHPSGKFAIVASSGDEFCGEYARNHSPSTKYPKGDATAKAVAANQMALDFGPQWALPHQPIDLTIWLLLYHVTAQRILLELSLPTEFKSGFPVGWTERIILEPVLRDPGPGVWSGPDDTGPDRYDVDVSARTQL